MVDQPRDQIKLEAFRQHWEQMRHVENMRLSFTSFYAAVVAGVLAFISRGEDNNVDYSTLFIVLAVLSGVGFILCIRSWQALEGHRDRALFLAGELIGECDPEKDPQKLKNYVPYYGPRPKFYSFWNLRILFPLLYIMGIIFFALLATRAIHLL